MFLLVSQFAPVYPVTQAHEYALTKSVQAPPLLHGVPEQSSISKTEHKSKGSY